MAWREGGRRGGKRDGETCDYLTTAKEFKALVEVAGERRPEGYPQGCRGVKPAAAEKPAPKGGGKTFAEAVTQYLDHLRRAKPRQVELYRRLFSQHVQDAVVKLADGTKIGPLGKVQVEEITTEIIEAWVAWMAARTYVYRKARPARVKRDKTVVPEAKEERRSYSAKTIHNIHGGVISPAMAYAARNGVIEANPCAGVELPDLEVQAVSLDEVPVGDEIPLWVEIGYEVSTLAGDLITLAMGTGLLRSRAAPTGDVRTVTVGSKTSQTVITFPQPDNTDGISLRCEDSGDAYIAWEVS